YQRRSTFRSAPSPPGSPAHSSNCASRWRSSMSSELERRLEAMLAEGPDPDPGAGEEALHRALRALHPAAPPRRALRTAALAFAAAVVLLVIAAGSLAAAGALHISIGTKEKPHAPTTR